MEAALRQRAEDYLGSSIEPSEWGDALSNARSKLAHIIGLFGDADGERREPYYLAQLIAEAVKANRLAAALKINMELREWGQKKDSPCQKTQGRPDTNPYCSTAVPKMQ